VERSLIPRKSASFNSRRGYGGRFLNIKCRPLGSGRCLRQNLGCGSLCYDEAMVTSIFNIDRGFLLTWRLLLSITIFPVEVTPGQTVSPSVRLPSPPRYEWRQLHDPDGIGKFYLGREIAGVIGHRAAAWLERPERELEERPSLLLASLQIQPGIIVADIGAGSGYFSRRLARLTGSEGRVYGVDIQPEMLELLSTNMAALQITNVVPVLGTITNVNLAAQSMDLALLVDVYHEFSHPYEMMESICRALKPGGRVVLVEYRAEDPQVPIKRLHKMTQVQVKQEMAAHPLEWVRTIEVLPRQHILVFEKTASAVGATQP
jgi:precorrin-6B methylase 2